MNGAKLSHFIYCITSYSYHILILQVVCSIKIIFMFFHFFYPNNPNINWKYTPFLLLFYNFCFISFSFYRFIFTLYRYILFYSISTLSSGSLNESDAVVFKMNISTAKQIEYRKTWWWSNNRKKNEKQIIPEFLE